MKYYITLSAPAANTDALITEIKNLDITVEGTAFSFLAMCPSFKKVTAFSVDDLQPSFAIEADYKIQNVSAGWAVQVITDAGQVSLTQPVTATIAKFTRGVLYLVEQSRARALQVIVTPTIIVVPTDLIGATKPLVVQSTTMPYFAFEEGTPQGENTLGVIQFNVVAEAVQVNNILASQSKAIKASATMSNIQQGRN
jgi:hypothetical protein